MKTHNNIKSLLIASIVLVAVPAALAQGVGNLGSLPTNFELGTGGWTVIDPAGTPIPVSLDPNGPVWGKNFTGPQGQPFSYPALAPPIPVREVLQVAPTLPWTDWHEDVIDPDWVWLNPTVFVNSVQIFPTFVGVGTNSLSMFFTPALNVGDVVLISKSLAYNGLPGTTFFGTLPIHEYPTGVPEPSSLGLLALGALLVRRNRG